MVDLSTSYLGLELKTPLVVSASPLSEDLGRIRLMEDCGAAAVVLPSLFEEQLTSEGDAFHDSLDAGVESFAEALDFFPSVESYRFGPDGYLEMIYKAKQAVSIPIIASLNGATPGGWIEYAKFMEQAGADALELNIYYVASDPSESPAAIEQRYLDVLADVRAAVHLPVAVKLGPYFTSFGHFARRLDAAGANGLVLFNRFYQPDIDIEALEVKPNLVLSDPSELRLRLHWAAALYGLVKADIAITGGVHSAEDVIRSMMAGGRVAMMASALLRHGIGYLEGIRADLIEWMEEREYESIRQMQGSMSFRSVPKPELYSRVNYMRVLNSYAL